MRTLRAPIITASTLAFMSFVFTSCADSEHDTPGGGLGKADDLGTTFDLHKDTPNHVVPVECPDEGGCSVRVTGSVKVKEHNLGKHKREAGRTVAEVHLKPRGSHRTVSGGIAGVIVGEPDILNVERIQAGNYDLEFIRDTSDHILSTRLSIVVHVKPLASPCATDYLVWLDEFGDALRKAEHRSSDRGRSLSSSEKKDLHRIHHRRPSCDPTDHDSYVAFLELFAHFFHGIVDEGDANQRNRAFMDELRKAKPATTGEQAFLAYLDMMAGATRKLAKGGWTRDENVLYFEGSLARQCSPDTPAIQKERHHISKHFDRKSLARYLTPRPCEDHSKH